MHGNSQCPHVLARTIITEKFSPKKLSISAVWVWSLFLFFGLQVEASPKFSIVWSTETHNGASNFLKDENGNALSAGNSMNGDGDLVEIGYFSEGSFAIPFQDNAFKGNWKPLTINTRVGDSSSGYGFPNGMFTFKTTFTQNTNYVTTFWGEPKYFTEYLNFDITSNSPPPQTTPVCIRFYDSPNKIGARYNTVSGQGWRWPNFPNGSSIPTTSYFKIAPGNAPPGSFWVHGNTFEHSVGAYKTTISPEYEINISVMNDFTQGGAAFIQHGESNITSIAKVFGEEVSIKAFPNNPRYEFMGWIGNGISESWNKTTTLTVNGDQTVYAEFFEIPYLLTLEVQGEGSVSGSGTFGFDDNVTISAWPSFGHSFVRWEKDGTPYSTSSEETITIDGDTDLVAIFARNQYQVNVGSTEGGTLEILDDSGSTASIPLSHGLSYTLRALPDPHYGFSSWASTPSGLSMLDNQSFAQTTFIPTADVNYTAIFSELFYKLNIESTQGYSSLSASGSFPALSMVPVKVKPTEGFVFDYWLDPVGILTDTESNETEANMSRIYPYTEAKITAILSLDRYSDSDINVTSEIGGSTSLQTNEDGGFTHNHLYELNATADVGYYFDHWEGDIDQLEKGPFSSENMVLIEGPLSIIATYKYSQYPILLSSIGEGFATGPETFTVADTPLVKALPFAGYRFTRWSGDTQYLLDPLAMESIINFESNSIPQNINLTANFEPEIHNIDLFVSEGNGSVNISLYPGESFDSVLFKSLNVDSETQIIFEAFPSEGWSFSNWSGLPDINDLFNPVAEVNQYSNLSYFYPTKDLNISANFRISEYTSEQIKVYSGGGGNVGISKEVDGNFLHFESYDLNATPLRGYEFSEWKTDPSQSHLLLNGINAPANRLKVDGPIEINATFETIYYDIFVSTNEGGVIILNGHPDGKTSIEYNYNVDDFPTLEANASAGWEFSHWSGDTQYLTNTNAKGTSIDHSSLPLKDLNISANFVREEYFVYLDTEGSGTFEIHRNSNLHNSGTLQETLLVDSGTRLVISANPSNGWKFSRWFGLPHPSTLLDSNALLDQTLNYIDFIPSDDANITAKYVKKSYTLSSPAPEFGGTVTGDGKYLFESMVDIVASPLEHYTFKQWSGDTSHLIYSITEPLNKVSIPDSNISLSPIFVPKLYNISTFSDNNGSIETSSEFQGVSSQNLSEYNASSEITINAFPDNTDEHMLGYIYWENSLGRSGYWYSPTLTIPFLDGNYSFLAYFIPRNEVGYSLFVTPPYAGSAGEVLEYSSAQQQRLQAISNHGFSFLGWTSNTISSFYPNWSSHAIDVELIESDEIWANFAPQANFLKLEFQSDHGSVLGFEEKVTFGEDLVLTAIPKENYEFVNWELIKEATFQVERNQSTINPLKTRIYLNSEESPELFVIRGFTYHFDCNLSDGDGFFISTSNDSNDQDSYYLTGINGHLTDSGVLSFTVPLDAPDTLYYHASAAEHSGNRIKVFSINDESLVSRPSSHILSERITHHFGIKANFERTRHSFDLSSSGQGNVHHIIQDTYFWGDEIEISATPLEHWYFSHWDENPAIEDPNSSTTNITVLEDTEAIAIFEKVTYLLDVNPTPSDYGVVDIPTKTLTYGDEVTLSATPQVGKQFDGWVNLENLVLVDPEDQNNKSATFKILGNAKVVAEFSRIPVNLDIQFISLDKNNALIDGDLGGTVTKPSAIFYGDSIELNATIFEGYSFLHWIDLLSGEIISPQKNIKISPKTDQNLQVVLRKLHYQFDATSTEGGAVSIATNPPFYWGDEIDIVATPDEHWVFSRWTGVGSENIDAPYNPNTKLVITKDSSLVAEFKPQEYSVSVTVTPDGFGGVSNLQNSYHYGDKFEVNATTRTGKLFKFWSIESNASIEGNASLLDSSTVFRINGNANITAHFDSKTYNVTKQVVVVDQLGEKILGVYGGKILGGNQFKDEDIAEFTYSLNNGYNFKHWITEESGEPISTEKFYKHEIRGDLNLTAVVTERKYDVEISISPSESGYILLNGDVISASRVLENFTYGSDLNISAHPEGSNYFVKWGVTGTNNVQESKIDQSFTLDNDIKIVAYFAPEGLLELKLDSKPAGAASYLFGGGSFEYDPNHSILAMAKKGYEFSHWEYNGTLASGIVRDPYSSSTSVNLDGDKELTAFFKSDNSSPPSDDSNKLYLLSVYSNNITQGTANGSGFFRGTRTIKAFPKEGFIFSHWEGAELISNAYDEMAQVIVSENLTVTAHFQTIGLFEDSNSLENGWWGNPWFGYFWKVGDEDWLFHEKLGWIFMKKKGDNSIWVWIQKMNGWFWTAKEHYPYLHSSINQNWYYVNLNQSNYNTLIVYNYLNSTWESW